MNAVSLFINKPSSQSLTNGGVTLRTKTSSSAHAQSNRVASASRLLLPHEFKGRPESMPPMDEFTSQKMDLPEVDLSKEPPKVFVENPVSTKVAKNKGPFENLRLILTLYHKL